MAREADLKLWGRALAQLRADREISQEQAGESFGTSGANWAKYERGQAPSIYFPDVQDALTRALGFDAETLRVTYARLKGDPAPAHRTAAVYDFRSARRDDPQQMPIRSRIQAAWVMNDAGAAYGHYHLGRDPRFPEADQYLAELLDDSADGLGIQRGDLAQLAAASDISYWPRTGDVVEVERLRSNEDEREITLRQVEVTATQVLLWPRSSNPRLRDPLTLPADPDAAPEGPRILGLLLGATRRF